MFTFPTGMYSNSAYSPAILDSYSIATGGGAGVFLPFDSTLGVMVPANSTLVPYAGQLLDIDSAGELTANGSAQNFTGSSARIAQYDGAIMSATSGIMSYSSTGGSFGEPSVQGFTISGSTISAGTEVSLFSSAGGLGDIERVDDTHAIVSYRESGQRYAELTLSGNTVTKGTEVNAGLTDTPAPIKLVSFDGTDAVLCACDITGRVDIIDYETDTSSITDTNYSGRYTAYSGTVDLVVPNANQAVVFGNRTTASTSRRFATLLDISGTPSEDDEIEVFADVFDDTAATIGNVSIGAVALDDTNILVIAPEVSANVLWAAILKITGTTIEQVGDSVDITPADFFRSAIRYGGQVSPRVYAFGCGANGSSNAMAITVGV